MTETPGVRQAKGPDDLTRQLWERFVRGARKMRGGAGWLGCEVCPSHERDPNEWTEIHHVLSQQRLKKHARENSLPAVRLLELLTDPRNSIVLCRPHHAGHTYRYNRLPLSAIPDAAWAFAKELGLEDELVAEYTGSPERPQEAADPQVGVRPRESRPGASGGGR